MKVMSVISATALAACLTFATVSAQAQTKISPESAQGMTSSTAQFSNQQLIVATVHQAWLMSGKNEQVFFGMVTRLAEISAQNRGLELPDTKAAGERVGNLIKTMAKADTDQLLYAVVDKAVREVGKPVPVK
jgi:hypothetical protein